MAEKLSVIEKKVIETATEFQKSHYDWMAPNIQFRGWPDTKTYQSVKLGISAAIQRLKRKGLIVNTGRGSYRLAEVNTDGKDKS